MKTGLSKKQKTTSVFFDEASPIIEVCTYNTSLKKRLSEYAGKYPSECRLVDDDEKRLPYIRDQERAVQF